MIDTHAHMHGKEFTGDIDDVLARTASAGVERVVLIGVDVEDGRRALELARRYPGQISVVSGVHPHEANLWSADTRADLAQLLAEPEVVGLGEIGLDYHYDFSPREQQRDAFLAQLELSRELDKPVVIHCREAYVEVMQHLKDFYETPGTLSSPRGVLHCYFGNADQAREAAELGYLLGIGGSCTFKKAQELHDVVRQVPLEQLVLETDAPYMTPVPFRGKRNESSYIPLIAARIAELKGVPVEDVIHQTTANAKRLYRI